VNGQAIQATFARDVRASRARNAVVPLLFFLSGCAALLFETLWFRQASLALGNAVWSTSVVLGAFMAGLALGSTLAARHGVPRRPMRSYALIEALVGVTGLLVVLVFPWLTRVLAPWLGEIERPSLLSGARFLISFSLLVVPATGMGATLPILVGALSQPGTSFGRVLDWLAAILVYGLFRARDAQPERTSRRRPVLDRRSVSWLVAAWLCGGVLLALEVVWFRFLLLWVSGTSLTFALMLAVVLVGIGAGSLLAGAALRLYPLAERFTFVVAALACVSVSVGYAGFQQALQALPSSYGSVWRSLYLCGFLMLPTCLSSGALFTWIGQAFQSEGGDEAASSGWLTLANTLGAMLGALGGGLLLLPGLGIERSFFWLAALYLVVALLSYWGRPHAPRLPFEGMSNAMAACLAVLVLALFPFGLMRNHYLKRLIERWAPANAAEFSLLALREGLTETVGYVQTSTWNEPVLLRLFTNASSMSGTNLLCARYMRLFVHLPVALKPELRDALLISYGVGSTADALTHTASLRSIDVVDISRDVLELGRLVFPRPGSFPLDDPRVHVSVEDGRFFLLTTHKRFDLITAEPPPPKNAGIVNLYSEEYFELARARLNEGGLISYWLPVYQMTLTESKAVTRAFCDVFPDCTLWSGAGAEWILLGSRGTMPSVSEEQFVRQWHDPRVSPWLARIGIEEPEQLGSLFLADAHQLQAWTQGVAPVDDDHPYRLSPISPTSQSKEYLAMARPETVARSFAASDFVATHFPATLRARTLQRLELQEPGLAALWVPWGMTTPPLSALHYALTSASYRAPVLWLMGSDYIRKQAADRARQRHVKDDRLFEYEGIDAMAERDYEHAESLLAAAAKSSDHAEQLLRWRILALELAGKHDRAEVLLRAEAPALHPTGSVDWRWLTQQFGLPNAVELVLAPAPAAMPAMPAH
jgi:predicted membrane-bound spermidine synthase